MSDVAKKSVAVLLSGYGSNLQALIDAMAMQSVHYSIDLVISNVADAYGLKRAQSASIKTVVMEHQQYASRLEFDKSLVQVLQENDIGLVVLAGFMRRLSPYFVDRFAGRLLNIHPSLLPRHPGLNTHRRVIEAGDQEHGCSVHFVTAVLDGGPVIAQQKFAVATDDEQVLKQQVQQLEYDLYWRVVDQVAAGGVEIRDGIAAGWCDEASNLSLC
jgi:phosphoribosylglycinamide formyltransferase 1